MGKLDASLLCRPRIAAAVVLRAPLPRAESIAGGRGLQKPRVELDQRAVNEMGSSSLYRRKTQAAIFSTLLFCGLLCRELRP